MWIVSLLCLTKMSHSSWRFLKPCKWLMDADACLQIIHYVNMWNIAFWQRGGDGRAGNAFAWHAKRRRQILSTVYAHTRCGPIVWARQLHAYSSLFEVVLLYPICVIHLSWPTKWKTKLCNLKLGHEGMLGYRRVLYCSMLEYLDSLQFTANGLII